MTGLLAVGLRTAGTANLAVGPTLRMVAVVVVLLVAVGVAAVLRRRGRR